MEEKPKLTLLSVLAHPDDESFGMGGTLSLYAKRGYNVHLVCATRGEVGMVDEQFMQGFKTIAELRESELRCAAGMLGLSGVHFLGYRDSGMPGTPDNTHPQALAAAPIEEVAAKIVHSIRLLKPQVVLTFDPIGGYKHPDHIAIHKATVIAFKLAGDPDFAGDLPPYQPQKLYFHVIPKRLMKFGVWAMSLFGRDPHHFGRNGDIDIAALVDEGDFPVHAEIDFREVEDRKNAAAECHASQLGGGIPRNGFMAWMLRRIGSREQFMRAYPPPNGRVRKEKDLFAEVQ